MTSQELILELVCEELPPRSLHALSTAFAKGVSDALAQAQLLAPDCSVHAFATPRRLAVHFGAVLAQAPEQKFSEKLMPSAIGLDAAGAASPALLKKLAARGLEHLGVADLARRHDGKQEILYAEGTAPGATLEGFLQQALDGALAQLPIARYMQYQLADGVTNVRFVRPVQRLLALWGSQIIPLHAFGMASGRISLGHRFMGTATLNIASAQSWHEQLRTLGMVIPSWDERRALILAQLQQAATAAGASIGAGAQVEALLDEVNALVEYPCVYTGEFEPEYLAVPSECLILTMRQNQKYFPLFDPASGALTHRFLIVSNMRVADPRNIIEGNQRVIRPRLADARFFFETDLKTPLAKRVAELAQSVYHNRLGSQLARTERVELLARWLAQQLGADPTQSARAAQLAHADLGTLMVGEFPELQGIMGAYYAAHDNEAAAVVQALRAQYQLRVEDPVTPANLVACVLYMAERAETLIGIWGIGLVPSGERDPYGLRRAALGLISAYEQLCAGGVLPASTQGTAGVRALLEQAQAGFAPGLIAAGTLEAVLEFVYERYRNQLSGHAARSAIDAVLALQPPLHQVAARVAACSEFVRLPQAEALASANKRIGNILKKATEQASPLRPDLLRLPQEIELSETIARLQPEARAALQAGEFTQALALLAQVRSAVDNFFTDVMVMDEDPAVRANRLALLRELHQLMNQVADISRLAQ